MQADEILARYTSGSSAMIESDGIAIDISNQRIQDFSFLKGLPVTTLRLSNCGLRELTSLKGLPLRRLFVNQII